MATTILEHPVREIHGALERKKHFSEQFSPKYLHISKKNSNFARKIGNVLKDI